LLIAGFGALALWYGIQLAIVNSQLTSPALEINLAWLYIAPAVGGALIILYSLAMLFEPMPAPDGLDQTGIAAAGND
jgi:TRAP-type C4-dicarboxylate transport system permease small subunit